MVLWFNFAMPQSFSTPRTIALIGRYHSPEVADTLLALAQALSDRGVKVLVEADTADNIAGFGAASGHGLANHHTLGGLAAFDAVDFTVIGYRADVAIVVGGDGTMLNAARQLARYRVPLVGVNQGRLGFMTDIARSDMLSCLDDLLEGRFIPESRLLLGGEVVRGGEVVAANVALNDVVVDKGAISRLIEFELFIDGEFIYSLRADGLIVSTPTGSTAYSLSANGPILHPTLGGIALVPLCPHALTNRPITIPETKAIEIRILSADDSRVHFDGQVTQTLCRYDSVRLFRSEHSVCFLHPPGYSYFAMLRQKLQWSEKPKGT